MNINEKPIHIGIKRYNKIISINAFIIGTVVMALEMTGSRFLTPYFGSSVFTWASIISMVLLSLSVGYFLGGYLAEKKPNTFIISLLILLAGYLILFIPSYYEDLFNWLYDLISSNKSGGFFASVLTLFFPLLLLGMYSPFSVKLMSRFSDRPGKIAGNLYALSTFGSILGTIGVSFFLIPVIGTKSIIYALSFITFLSALTLFFIDIKNQEKRNKIFGYLFFSLFFVLFSFYQIKNSFFYSEKESKYLLEKAESEYNTIIIKQKGVYISMSFRRQNTGHIESKINIMNDKELPLSYSQLMQAGFIYKTNPRNLLMIGLGGGVISNYISNYFKDIKIDGVELDKEVIRLAKKYFNIKNNDNINIFNEDGRLFLNGSDKIYDIIMLDAYRGGYVPYHLCTDEFFKLVKKHIVKDGIIVINLHRGSKLYPRILYTIQNNFKYTDLFPSASKGNIIVTAYNYDGYTTDLLLKNADSLQNKYQFYYNLNDIFNLREKNQSDINFTLLTDDFAPVNFLNAIKEHNLN